MISVVVEGDTDIPFVRKLCAHAKFELNEPVVDSAGKGNLDAKLRAWANAANGAPYLVVRDLDQDAQCAVEWLSTHRPSNAGKWLCVRLAVRALEAWFLADAHHAAKRLRIDERRIPLRPDDEPDPKATVVALARRSTKPSIVKGLVPRAGQSRKIGADYEGWLIESGAGWSVDRAILRSPSLARATIALARLRREYDAFLAGGA